MANEIRTKFDAVQNFTMTLAGMATNVSRQSTVINNATKRGAALIYLRIRSGANAPTAGTVYECYLIRGDGAGGYYTDGAGAADAAIVIVNAQLLGTMVVFASANQYFYGDFDTAPLGPLGPTWGIAVKNATDQSLSNTEADHLKEYAYYLPEVQ